MRRKTVCPSFGPTITQQRTIDWSLGEDPFGLNQRSNHLSLKFFTCQFTVSDRLQSVICLKFCCPTRARLLSFLFPLGVSYHGTSLNRKE